MSTNDEAICHHNQKRAKSAAKTASKSEAKTVESETVSYPAARLSQASPWTSRDNRLAFSLSILQVHGLRA
jgi:hypothetical protein